MKFAGKARANGPEDTDDKALVGAPGNSPTFGAGFPEAAPALPGPLEGPTTVEEEEIPDWAVVLEEIDILEPKKSFSLYGEAPTNKERVECRADLAEEKGLIRETSHRSRLVALVWSQSPQPKLVPPENTTLFRKALGMLAR
jgi:hypothetical protein